MVTFLAGLKIFSNLWKTLTNENKTTVATSCLIIRGTESKGITKWNNFDLKLDSCKEITGTSSLWILVVLYCRELLVLSTYQNKTELNCQRVGRYTSRSWRNKRSCFISILSCFFWLSFYISSVSSVPWSFVI